MPTILLKLLKNKYVLIGIAVFIAILLLYFIWHKYLRKDPAEKDADARDSLESKALEAGVNPQELLDDAKSLFVEMGYDGIWGIPWPWENEAAVIKTVNKYDSVSYLLLAQMYYRIYKRNLTEDIRNALTEGAFGNLTNIIP